MLSINYWIWLSSLSGIGVKTAKKYLDYFGTPEKIYNASDIDLYNVPDISARSNKIPVRDNLKDAEKIITTCMEKHFQIITLDNSEYPDRLKNIYDPPIVLYINGKLPDIDKEPVVAIVGTRRCTPYGIKTAENIAYKLSERGIIIITGLALGVDSAASIGALRGNNITLGVIGSGLDIIYPSENRELFHEVSHRGAIISEYAPGIEPTRNSFPMRNRIISGLALGVLIIEAPSKSGALITAARALEQGRDVFALPGNIDAKMCEGSNLLIRDGAIPVLSHEDIIEEYELLFPDKILSRDELKTRIESKDTIEKFSAPDIKNIIKPSHQDNRKTIDIDVNMHYIDLKDILTTLSGDEKTVAEVIGYDNLHVDEIIKKSKLPAHKVLASLTLLEISDKVENTGNKIFKLK